MSGFWGVGNGCGDKGRCGDMRWQAILMAKKGEAYAEKVAEEVERRDLIGLGW